MLLRQRLPAAYIGLVPDVGQRPHHSSLPARFYSFFTLERRSLRHTGGG